LTALVVCIYFTIVRYEYVTHDFQAEEVKSFLHFALSIPLEKRVFYSKNNLPCVCAETIWPLKTKFPSRCLDRHRRRSR